MTAEFHRPTTLDEALELLASLDNAMVYGGGTAIQILTKQGLLFADHLIDVGAIPALAEFAETDAGFHLGAAVPIRSVERSQRVQQRARLVAEAYGRVANPRIRNTATIGGNLSHGDYRLDPPTALMAIDASVEISRAGGRRTMPVREFFVDFQQTALEPGEMVTAIDVPAAPVGSGSGYAKMSSLAMNDWPVASVAALLEPAGETCSLRLGIGALAPMPRYGEVDVSGLGQAEAIAAGLEAVERLLDPIPDVRGGVDYKRHLGQVAATEAIETAWKDRDDH
jgi:carbon-monoxide dehydrogenase medium subunit